MEKSVNFSDKRVQDRYRHLCLFPFLKDWVLQIYDENENDQSSSVSNRRRSDSNHASDESSHVDKN